MDVKRCKHCGSEISSDASPRGICAKCLMKDQCLGACIAQNYYRTESLWAPFWFCDAAEEEGLFPETRLARTPHKPERPSNCVIRPSQ